MVFRGLVVVAAGVNGANRAGNRTLTRGRSLQTGPFTLEPQTNIWNLLTSGKKNNDVWSGRETKQQSGFSERMNGPQAARRLPMNKNPIRQPISRRHPNQPLTYSH